MENRNEQIANEKAVQEGYMNSTQGFPPLSPLVRTYNALKKAGYSIEDFSEEDVKEISAMLKKKQAESSEGCVTAMLIVFAVLAGAASGGVLLPFFAIALIVWIYKRKKK